MTSNHSPGRTALYRLWDAKGALLYAGISHYPEARWTQHAMQKKWWHLVAAKTVEWFDTREQAKEAEVRASREERPRYDQTARLGKGQHTVPRLRIDDSAGRDAVRSHVLAEIEAGRLQAGGSIKSSRVARALDVAPATARDAFLGLVRERRLDEKGGGWFRVLAA
ncbi:GIY-YIG nuclease family protein [Streptomyces flavotricini]|uniref:GIY-YIG nuclease family protein n=1 Tax=Streptomyces flavotricini TaxID=66888 RepID=A0ABS8EE68_9ACTN|nr:GIY-YIG nuclease family protein [Streptomyces flavotricini]MCC0099426.1 GIY-YIG nuclease family protein [Streptomyces flavotricini]